MGDLGKKLDVLSRDQPWTAALRLPEPPKTLSPRFSDGRTLTV